MAAVEPALSKMGEHFRTLNFAAEIKRCKLRHVFSNPTCSKRTMPRKTIAWGGGLVKSRPRFCDTGASAYRLALIPKQAQRLGTRVDSARCLVDPPLQAAAPRSGWRWPVEMLFRALLILACCLVWPVTTAPA